MTLGFEKGSTDSSLGNSGADLPPVSIATPLARRERISLQPLWHAQNAV